MNIQMNEFHGIGIYDRNHTQKILTVQALTFCIINYHFFKHHIHCTTFACDKGHEF
jgi:hypothetical protein